jgi:hypothetical protein
VSGTWGNGSPLVVMRPVASLLMSVLAVSAAATSAEAADDPLARHRWRDRVLVVVAPDAEDARLAGQRRIVRDAGRGFGERDLAIVEGVGGTVRADALRRRFGLDRGSFAAILVGKDGGEKLRSSSALPAERLFETIDAMPMRRDEMRRGPSASR